MYSSRYRGENREEFETLTSEVKKIIPELNHVAVPPRDDKITAVIHESGNVIAEMDDISSGLEQSVILVTYFSSILITH